MKRLALLLCVLFSSQLWAAIAATTVWELRSTGASHLNAGGYNPSNATPGTDYSQQDTAEDTGTDLACADGDAATPVITSASHNFVDSDEGNLIHITAGTGWTAGYYEIVSTAANAATLDRACGTDGSKADGTWYLGGAILTGNTATDGELFAAASGNGIVPGNTVYVKGDWALAENITSGSNDATAVSPVTMIGYSAARATEALLTDRPTITTGASYTFIVGDYWIVKNLIFTGSAASVFTGGASSVAANVKSTNSSATANRTAMSATGGCMFINCEATSTNGTAMTVTSSGGRFVNCFMYDSVVGLLGGSGYGTATGCVIHNCTTGIGLSSNDYWTLIGNTLDDCDTGIDASDSFGLCAMNNIIDASTTKYADWDTATPSNFWDYNLWGADAPAPTNVTTGPHDVLSTAFAFTDTSTHDFTVPTSSVAIDAGSQVGPNVGLKAAIDYDVNIGVDQGDHPAGALPGGASQVIIIALGGDYFMPGQWW